jgi:malonyl-CoA O-methyltransferase
MALKFDKKIIEKNFSRGAKNYDEAALIQREVAKKLCDLAAPFIKNEARILDLGAGTGFVAKNIFDLVSEKKIQLFESDISFEMLKQNSESSFKVQSDFENLPFKNNSFDLLISSFSLQWLENLEETFSHFFSLLKPSGALAFCLPTPESLNELKSANIFNFTNLPKAEDLILALQKNGFTEKKFQTEILEQEFESGLQALQSIKKIGAN